MILGYFHYVDDILIVYNKTSTDTDDVPQACSAIHPILLKKEIIDNYGTRSFHYFNHSNATWTVRGQTTQHHLFSKYSYSNTPVTYGLPYVAGFIVGAHYGKPRVCYIISIPLRGYVAREKNHLIFDTSTVLKKSETRRIYLTKCWLFSHIFCYCMELLYMETTKKMGPISRHISSLCEIFVLLYLMVV